MLSLPALMLEQYLGTLLGTVCHRPGSITLSGKALGLGMLIYSDPEKAGQQPRQHTTE